MAVLKWIKNTGDFHRVMAFYNELSRKFLLEGKWQAARVLLENYMPSDLGAEHRAQLERIKKESEVPFCGNGDQQLIAFERER